MATMSKDRRSGKVVGYNIQWRENNQRRNIYLSAKHYREQTAKGLKEKIERLLYDRRNGHFMPDKMLANWLATLPAEQQAKLANAGLIHVEKSRTCQEVWDSFLKHRAQTVKPSSLTVYRHNQTVFFETFSPNTPIESITVDDLLNWKAALLANNASATVAGYIGVTRMVFDWAVEQDWLRKNPAKKIPQGSFANRENDRVISMAEYAKLLEACPNQEWRTIRAWARIGGLRCPSELKRLRWSDVNWAENRFLVRPSKTERYEEHRERIIPLFPELRIELDRLFLSEDAVGC
jgi:integrase